MRLHHWEHGSLTLDLSPERVVLGQQVNRYGNWRRLASIDWRRGWRQVVWVRGLSGRARHGV